MPDPSAHPIIETSPRDVRRSMRRPTLVCALTLCVVAACGLAGRQSAGTLSYATFVMSGVIFAVALTCLATWSCPVDCRRAVGFRLAAVWLGTGISLSVWELAALLAPVATPMDNPWYVFNRGGIRNSEILMVERPPHIRWSGWSRGDLSVLSREPDRFARRITFETDFQGFRNSRDVSTADVIFLGDSFTEAGNVPEAETFAARTARLLNRTGRNLGRATYCPSAELAVLVKFGLPCHPDVVVWQIAESNDLLEEVDYREWKELGRLPLPLDNQQDGSSRWKRRSPTYQLYARWTASHDWPFAGTFAEARGKTVRMLFLASPNEEQRPDGHMGWPLLSGALRTGAAHLKERGVRLIVLLIPMKVRVYGAHVTFSESFPEARRGAWDVPESETLGFYLTRLCSELDVPFMDATPFLQEAAGQGKLVYLPADTHLSSEGHRLVAERLAPVVGDESRAR